MLGISIIVPAHDFSYLSLTRLASFTVLAVCILHFLVCAGVGDYHLASFRIGAQSIDRRAPARICTALDCERTHTVEIPTTAHKSLGGPHSSEHSQVRAKRAQKSPTQNRIDASSSSPGGVAMLMVMACDGDDMANQLCADKSKSIVSASGKT